MLSEEEIEEVITENIEVDQNDKPLEVKIVKEQEVVKNEDMDYEDLIITESEIEEAESGN